MVTRRPALVAVQLEALLADLRHLIDQARAQVAQAANSTLTLLYWHVGQRIRREVLGEQRAEYGARIFATLSQELVRDYGKGFNTSALSRVVQFAESFPDEAIVAALSQQLGWSHFVEILPLKQPLEREFYAEMCRVERWSVRTLRERIGSQLYLRSALAKTAPLQQRLHRAIEQARERAVPGRLAAPGSESTG